MATLNIAFKNFILQDVDVAALLGVKFYWDKVQDGASLPYVRARTIVDALQYHQKGSGPSRATVQLDIWNDNEPGIDALLSAIEKRCSGYRGNIDTYDVRIFVTNKTDSWSEDLHTFHRMLEVEIGYV